MPDNTRKYPLSLGPLWRTKNGEDFQGPIGAETFDNLQKIGKTGRIQVRMNRYRKDEKSPHAWLEYLSEEDIAAARAAWEAKQPATKPESTEETI